MSEPDRGGGWSEPRPEQAGAGSSPSEIVANAAQAVKQETASFAEDARGRAAEKLDEHKATATQTLGDFANAIRKAGDELSGADQSMAGRVVRQAADGLESFARTMSDKRPEELIDAIRDFGRRNPTAFIAGSVLAGVALGRFLKSSGASSTHQGGVSGLAARPAAGLPRTEKLGLIGSGEAGGATFAGPEATFTPDDPIAEATSNATAGSDAETDRARFGPGS